MDRRRFVAGSAAAATALATRMAAAQEAYPSRAITFANPCVLIVNDKQPYQTLKDFIDDAKKRQDGLIFSSSGLYGALHLPMALFMKSAGIKLRHLPTAGGGPALTALMGNNSQALVS